MAELFINRTSDGQKYPNYTTWSIQIIKLTANGFMDITSNYFEKGQNFSVDGDVMYWMEIEEYEGDTYINAFISNTEKACRLFMMQDNHFVRIH